MNNKGKFATRVAFAASILLMGTACRQDMHDQPKFKNFRPSQFFEDGRSARPLVAGTVARGFLRDDAAFYAGKLNGKFVDTLPIPVNRELVLRGQERFDVFCAPCHGRSGDGQGMIVKRGMKQPPSYHTDRLRQAADGYLYDVITNGYGAMYDYSSQIAPRDRWAIVAYMRTLQYSRWAPVGDMPDQVKAKVAASRQDGTKR